MDKWIINTQNTCMHHNRQMLLTFWTKKYIKKKIPCLLFNKLKENMNLLMINIIFFILWSIGINTAIWKDCKLRKLILFLWKYNYSFSNHHAIKEYKKDKWMNVLPVGKTPFKHVNMFINKSAEDHNPISAMTFYL